MPTELAKRVICACIREICFFRDFIGLKRQKSSWSLLTRHLYTRQLACEPQTGCLAYFPVPVRNGTKETSSSLDLSSSSRSMQTAGFCCASIQGQTVLKVHANLNKGTSGSMKLILWHATTSSQPRKQYLGKNSLGCAGNVLALY